MGNIFTLASLLEITRDSDLTLRSKILDKVYTYWMSIVQGSLPKGSQQLAVTGLIL
jgi:hypothetical protein